MAPYKYAYDYDYDYDIMINISLWISVGSNLSCKIDKHHI